MVQKQKLIFHYQHIIVLLANHCMYMFVFSSCLFKRIINQRRNIKYKVPMVFTSPLMLA